MTLDASVEPRLGVRGFDGPTTAAIFGKNMDLDASSRLPRLVCRWTCVSTTKHFPNVRVVVTRGEQVHHGSTKVHFICVQGTKP